VGSNPTLSAISCTLILENKPERRNLLENNGKKKILIVEDREPLADIYSKVLSRNYQVAIALNGSAARKWAIELKPDLIIMDVILPDGEGFDIYKSICALIRKEPMLLIVSGFKTESNQQKAKRFNAKDFLEKPVSPGDLCKKVDEIFLKQ
jgi:DNA-binding response OmpR family regulator